MKAHCHLYAFYRTEIIMNSEEAENAGLEINICVFGNKNLAYFIKMPINVAEN